MSKLLGIDTLSILRPIFEVNPETDQDKRAEQAIETSIGSIGRVLGTIRPTHVLPAIDGGGHTWRHDVYPRYRESRAPMAAELRARIPDFIERLTRMGLHPVQKPGVEADDVLATGTMHWLSKGFGDVVIATSDKDLHQLIEYGALVYDHFKGEMHDADWVRKKFGVDPSQLGDYLALMGDSSDDIPGVDTIGKAKAAVLLQKYGTIDKIMAGAGILLDSTGRALRRGEQDLMLSRRLVTLKTDVRLDVTWKMLAMRPAD